MNHLDNKFKSESITTRDPAYILRQKAEKKLGSMKELQKINLGPVGTKQIIHDLRVTQIEREIQNEELRKVQIELEKSRARFKDLYDYAPVGYVTLSEEGLIQETNITAAQLLGLMRMSMVKQPLTGFILPECLDIYYTMRKKLFVTGMPQRCELRMFRKNAPPFWAHLEAATPQDTDVAPLFQVVISDITERKQTEHDRRLSGTELSLANAVLIDEIEERKRWDVEKSKFEAHFRQIQKAESLRCMAGAIAHKFNNLLGAVMGNIELAMDNPSRKLDTNRHLNEAREATHRAAEVSRLLLTYLGHKSGKHNILDLSKLCRQNLHELRPGLPKHMELETDLPTSGPIIEANAYQIQQIMINLLTNAYEAPDENRGTIYLTIKTVSHTDIPEKFRFPLDWQAKNNLYACIEVRDTGSGITAENIEKLFDPFFTSKFTGRGMGLPVVLGILRVHHGAVTVESDMGRGSIFRVFLPVSD